MTPARITRGAIPALAALLTCGLAVDAASAAPSGRARTADPRRPVLTANAAARVQPAGETFQGAVQRFAWTEGGLYQVYAAPGRVTDLVLQPGEQLVGAGPIAAGDTDRWILRDTESGAGETRRVHVLLKPIAGNLATNLVINTDRRTYYVELRADPSVYMASVAWSYPQDALLALKARPAALVPAVAAAPAPSAGIDPARLNFNYRILGDRAAWRPTQVFDDGTKVVIIFPAAVATGDLPPLFVLDAAGKPALVNYRVQGQRIVVDRLFDAAELRLGDKRKARRVKIVRDSAR